MSAPADPYLLLLLVTHPAHYLSQGANILGIPLQGDSHGQESLILSLQTEFPTPGYFSIRARKKNSHHFFITKNTCHINSRPFQAKHTQRISRKNFPRERKQEKDFPREGKQEKNILLKGSFARDVKADPRGLKTALRNTFAWAGKNFLGDILFQCRKV